MNRTYLGIDIGTTNIKVGVCGSDGSLLTVHSLPSPMKKDATDAPVYDVQRLWEELVPCLKMLISEHQPRSIGVTGMSEPGILVDRVTGEVISNMLPWSDQRSERYAVQQMDGEQQRFIQTGLHNSYKYSVYKAMVELQPAAHRGRPLVWLQAAPYIVWRLTGRFGLDPTLALRTYAYDLNTNQYDLSFLHALSLPEDLFPPVTASGEPVGVLCGALAQAFGAKDAVSVSVCGHDHMCAAFAVGATGDDDCFLSLGTTGVLLGSFARRTLTDADFATGYSYGLHTVLNQMTWLGAIQAAGSAVDWCGRLIGQEDYHTLDAWMEARYAKGTGDILFLPYLSGSGAPHLNAGVRGAFLGLDLQHDKSDLAFAVLEGIGYEIKLILSHAPFAKLPKTIQAVGGGTRNRVLLQVLADVTGCEVAVSDCEQAALTGAALLASGMRVVCPSVQTEIYRPSAERHAWYQTRYTQAYLPMQQMFCEHTF